MSTMLSKEVRTYWKEKVSSKFSDRTNDIETENHNKITAISNAKYPAFEKSLGLAKLIKAFKVAELDLELFVASKERVEMNKKINLVKLEMTLLKSLKGGKELGNGKPIYRVIKMKKVSSTI